MKSPPGNGDARLPGRAQRLIRSPIRRNNTSGPASTQGTSATDSSWPSDRCGSPPLRPYQRKAVDSIFQHLTDHRSTAVSVPTGGGKTIMFCEVARQLDRRTLILAHREELLSQAAAKLVDTGIHAAIEQAGARASLTDTYVVASVQSLQGDRLRRFPSDHFGLIVIDECHHSPAQSYRNIIEHFTNASVLGVSATFQRLDELGYEGIFDSIAYETSIKQLVEDGYLAPIMAKTLPVMIDLRRVRRVAGDFNQAQLAEAVGEELERAADAVLENIGERRTLAFLPSINHSQVFAQLCIDRGISADYVTGSCADREQKVSRFLAGEIQLLTNCALLTEGFDCPACDCIVMLRPTQSEALYCQMVGRGTRIHPGKQNLLLLDFLWLTKGHDLCKPACLLGKAATEQEKDEINQACDHLGLEVDLFDEEDTDSLRAQLRANADSKAEVFDPLETVPVDPLDVDALRFHASHFAPPATARQIEALINMGIRRDRITCRYAASKFFHLLTTRRSRGLATVRQARRLRAMGVKHPWRVSFADAGRLISAFYDGQSREVASA
jgi:superfamily II DNA or RNA helicase